MELKVRLYWSDFYELMESMGMSENQLEARVKQQLAKAFPQARNVTIDWQH